MPYRSHDVNPVSQLVELKSVIIESNDGTDSVRPLSVELGIFHEEVELGKLTISVGTRKANLSLDLEGMEVVEKSKRGVDAAPANISTKTSTESMVQTSLETSVAAEAIASTEISMLSNAVKASGSISGKATNTATAIMKASRETDKDHVIVKAVGNDMWRIAEPDGVVLDRHYLNYDELCRLRPAGPKPNRQRAELSVFARQRDLDVIVLKDGRLLGSHAKDKIIGILMAKALNEVCDPADYDGVVTFSVSKVEHED